MKNIRLLSFILALAGTGLAARAHAFLEHAQPRVGSTAQASPAEVRIWFTEELEGAFSTIQVFNSAGAEVDRKDSKVDSSTPIVMTVSLPKLPAGEYKVKWSAIAVDTHHTTGTYNFTVARP